MERLTIPLDDYYGALLEALREGQEAQVDHLLHDFIAFEDFVVSKSDRRGGLHTLHSVK